MINTLLIVKEDGFKQQVSATLQNHYRDQLNLITMTSMQDAIEHLEVNKAVFDLIVFEQKSPSLTMAKILFPLGNGAKFIMMDEAQIDVTSLLSDFIIEQVSLSSVESDLLKVIKKFEVLGYLVSVSGINEEYVSVKPEIMASYCPLDYDVYIKMKDGRFIKLFTKGTAVERTDFDRYQKEKGIDLFYFNKNEYRDVLETLQKKSIKLPTPYLCLKPSWSRKQPKLTWQ
jgi:hypothetical protein